jgi:4-alpha-glucanotransferase
MSVPAHAPLFPPGYRGAGLLLHITSLPSRYGIGDMGPAAFEFIDRLSEAGQGWWQALPLGPTGYGDSPYQPLSSMAANGLLISPELLMGCGLLDAGACERPFSNQNVDYGVVIPYKHHLLETLWSNFQSGRGRDLAPAFEEFCHSQSDWLDDYALFRALKARHNGAHYLEWPAPLVRREPTALANARRLLAGKIDQIRFAQFLVYTQSRRLRNYAKTKKVRLIGDLPFFVAPDSADVWTRPDLFLLDDRLCPRYVAGTPPDGFSAGGQLWGNPVYDWSAIAREGYRWWIARIRALLEHVDVIRLDHFRAFSAAWHVPAGAATAQSGEWSPGPGASFFAAVRDALGGLPFIAEDLGDITPDVLALRDDFAIPGSRVLQFAFDGDRANPHLPENHPVNAVVYTGTHDNPTTRGWFEDLPAPDQRRIWRHLSKPDGEPRNAAPELLGLAWSSPAALAIAPFQDLLNLGNEGRMNVPGCAQANWRWRADRRMLCPPVFARLKELTHDRNRA